MIKVMPKQFNMLAFILKTVLALFSIALSFVAFYFFEQKGMIANFQPLNFKVDFSFSNFNFNVNLSDKVFERFLSSVAFALVVSSKPILVFLSIFAFVYAGVLVVARIIILLFTKILNAQSVQIKQEKTYGKVKNSAVSFYDILRNLNLTLTM